jgi:uncharacterized protein YacL
MVLGSGDRLMVEDDAATRRRIRVTLLVLPAVMVLLIIGGVFLGFYLSSLLGSSDSMVMPLIFATLGFVISVVLSLYVAKVVSRRPRRA